LLMCAPIPGSSSAALMVIWTNLFPSITPQKTALPWLASTTLLSRCVLFLYVLVHVSVECRIPSIGKKFGYIPSSPTSGLGEELVFIFVPVISLHISTGICRSVHLYLCLLQTELSILNINRKQCSQLSPLLPNYVDVWTVLTNPQFA